MKRLMSAASIRHIRKASTELSQLSKYDNLHNVIKKNE